LGINGKISELQAAMGLAVLPHMAQILQGRQEAVKSYQEKLNTRFKMLKLREESQWNYSYFPILFDSEETLLAAEQNLKANDILARRYFYPSLNTLPYTDTKTMPISEDKARRILCLPLYHNIEAEDIADVCLWVNEQH
jgi:dTDP-4-amino-4,6-dideoxygalactose transaminase